MATMASSRRCLVALAFASLVPAPAALRAQAQRLPEIPFGWRLTDAEVVTKAAAARSEEGDRWTSYVVEARATGMSPDTPVPQGKFTANLRVFSPAKDMPGQKGGRWYLHGEWRIVDPNASPEALRARHSPAIARGLVSAELSFDPTAEKGAISAVVRMPFTFRGGRTLRGIATFVGDERFEGTIAGTIRGGSALRPAGKS